LKVLGFQGFRVAHLNGQQQHERAQEGAILFAGIFTGILIHCGWVTGRGSRRQEAGGRERGCREGENGVVKVAHLRNAHACTTEFKVIISGYQGIRVLGFRFYSF
jgi:hypothetical protein